MIYRQILACLSLFILLPLSAKGFPPASPAGGNYLTLDGVDDYAVLDFETFGRLLPKGTEKFTVEAWIYPTTPPDNKNTLLTILHQQVSMSIVNDENEFALVEHPKGDLILLMTAYIEGKLGRRLSSVPLALNQWHHIAYQSNGKETTIIVNDFVWIRPHRGSLGHNASFPLDFVLGGFGKIIERRAGPKEKWLWRYFTGYIDEVRISTKARYDVEKKDFMPDGKFKNDAKTAALWHFDEPSGTREFLDASGNAYHLEGKNGAKTSIPLAVEPHGKLTTTWGQLKQLGYLTNHTTRDFGTQQ